MMKKFNKTETKNTQTVAFMWMTVLMLLKNFARYYEPQVDQSPYFAWSLFRLMRSFRSDRIVKLFLC